MAIGTNVNLKDRLIKKTTSKANNTGNTNIVNKATFADREIPIKGRAERDATHGTQKATFYIKRGLLQKLYNFAYWERYNITEAVNAVLTDGLKNKNTKERGK
jgi:hypothetical protein